MKNPGSSPKRIFCSVANGCDSVSASVELPLFFSCVCGKLFGMREINDLSPAACEAVTAYMRLRDRIDIRCDELASVHADRLTCRPGCSGCCINLSVFPVEFYAIASELASKGDMAALGFDDAARCGFLTTGLCALYASRPLICRTHGFPVRMADAGLPDDFSQVSFCELNFACDSGKEPVFDASNTLDIYAMNCELFAINIDFIRRLTGEDFGPTDRLPLRDILNL